MTDRRVGETRDRGIDVPLPAERRTSAPPSRLRRTNAQIATLAAQDWATTVDQLLDFSAAPADTEPAFLTDDTSATGRRSSTSRRGGSTAWRRPRRRCRRSSRSSGTATSRPRTTRSPTRSLMYQQNALFRSMATGNFRDLVQRCRCSPRCSSGSTTTPTPKGNPNENFARELMELFTLGVDQYTPGRRRRVGARVDRPQHARRRPTRNTTSIANRHDDGHEDVHGRHPELGRPRHHQLHPARRPDAQEDRGALHRHQDVDVLRLPRPRRHRSSRRSPTRSSPPTSRSTSSCARSSTTRPFLSDSATQGLVRSPVEWVVACMRAVGMTAEDANPQWWMADMGQQLFEPPNVSGWRPNEYWLTHVARSGRARTGPRYIIWVQRRRRHAERHRRA